MKQGDVNRGFGHGCEVCQSSGRETQVDVINPVILASTAYDYAFGDYDSATRAFTPGGAGTALRTLVSRSTAAAPDGIPGKSTQTLTIQDAAHGTTLYSATLLQSTGEVLSWQAHVHDDKNRLRSTLYSDGSSTTNAYSCCRLLFTVDRNGYKTLRSAETGKDHLYYAMEEVSLREITADHPTYYALARDFRVTQHFMDALGRETNTVTKTARTDGIMTNPNAWTPAYPRFANTMNYPFGISDYSVQSDQYGARTVAMRLSSGEAARSVEQNFHPTNYVMPSTVTSNIWYRNGHSISERVYLSPGRHAFDKAALHDCRNRQLAADGDRDPAWLLKYVGIQP